ncbi:MAG: hypothetical protein ACI8WB_004439 [Phenylobacterium sp.]|jgi:hypothetical protein
MFNLTLAILITSSLLLLSFYAVLQRKHQQEQRKRQAQYADRINNIKSAYKTTLELYSAQRVIRPSSINQFYNIINNFFVDQPVNEHNVNKLETLANAIAITIAREFNLTRSDEDIEWLKKKLLNFAIKLPNNGNGYTASFYHRKLKMLINGLNATRASFVQKHAA